MIAKLIRTYQAFTAQHPQFPLLNVIRDDITQLESPQIKNLPKDQQDVFCMGLLLLTSDSLTRQDLSTSAFGTCIDKLLRTVKKGIPQAKFAALTEEYKQWTMEMLNENRPTSVV